ncbi:MAG: hypothetical protein H3C62_06620 [Gemmatimonadaceae bacterium]|nr:hypothetical protein [Gemmatimonadaceae bacterium]
MTRRLRRGSALILVLIMTLSLAALAASAIYMTGSSGMLSRYHDKERDLAYALETALELGRSRLQRDTALVLYDTGYKQLLTNQPVYTSSGGVVTGLTVNLYAGYTGDTAGTYVPYVTLVATVSDATGLRQARRMDLQSQSFSRYALFANDFPSSASIGSGETFGGRVHANNRFIATSSGSPAPVFLDTVSAAGTISGTAQWSDTVSSTGGATAIPYPTATGSYWGASSLATYFYNVADAGGLRESVSSASRGRVEFLTIDVNNNGMIDSTEGFFRYFRLNTASDTTQLAVYFSGSPVALSNSVMLNQCGAFYTISGRREFFPVVMHKATWVRTRIQSSTYPTVTAAQATTMSALDRTAIVTILQQPTARCYPQGSPYLVNTERYTTGYSCSQDWYTYVTMYTWGSSPACGSSQQYGGQDTTFTRYSFRCTINQSYTDGRCTAEPTYEGYWDYYSGTSLLPTLPASVRQDVERPYLYPLNKVYNPDSRGVIYLNSSMYVHGVVRGFVTLYVNGVVKLMDDLTYDADPADTTNLCRSFFGLIAKDSISILDNAINRPRIYNTPTTTAGNVLTMGGDRQYTFQGVAMALGGSVNAANASGATLTVPNYTCPLGSSITASGGCMQIVGGIVDKTFANPYTSTTGSGFRALRQLDPCQNTNRRPPYFPLARTRHRVIKSFDVDARQFSSTTLIRAYYTRLRGSRAAP